MIHTGLDLKNTKRDKRDYSHKRTFGSFPISQLPDEYLLLSTILDQGSGYTCTAHSSCAVQESEHGIQFDPEWFYQKEGEVNGFPSIFGYDMRTLMKTGCIKGFKPLNNNETEAEKYKELSYFNVDRELDKFDDIRVAMWLAKEEKRCVVVGTEWFAEWMNTNNGIVPNGIAKQTIGGHAIKIAGWTKINEVEYLVVQNSWGKGVGKDGLFYFDRETVNRYFLWAFIWRSTPDKIQTISFILDAMAQVLRFLNMIVSKVGSIFNVKRN